MKILISLTLLSLCSFVRPDAPCPAAEESGYPGVPTIPLDEICEDGSIPALGCRDAAADKHKDDWKANVAPLEQKNCNNDRKRERYQDIVHTHEDDCEAGIQSACDQVAWAEGHLVRVEAEATLLALELLVASSDLDDDYRQALKDCCEEEGAALLKTVPDPIPALVGAASESNEEIQEPPTADEMAAAYILSASVPGHIGSGECNYYATDYSGDLSGAGATIPGSNPPQSYLDRATDDWNTHYEETTAEHNKVAQDLETAELRYEVLPTAQNKRRLTAARAQMATTLLWVANRDKANDAAFTDALDDFLCVTVTYTNFPVVDGCQPVEIVRYGPGCN